MIADLKPYESYRDTGLPWLGKVPTHWQVKRAKSVFERVDIRSKTGKEELLTVSSARGIVPRNSTAVTMFKAESYLGYKLCWPGDLVINSLWAWGGGLGVSNHHGIISSAYGVYRIRNGASMRPPFVHEVVRSSSFNWELRVRSKGVWISRLQLTDISFLDAPIHIPPSHEQDAIVRFLAWANGRLERAIRAKRKVIALLNEQKQAIIHLAVTRGLDASVRLKSCGLAWAGNIPEHWEVQRLSSVAAFQSGKAHEQFVDEAGEFVCVTARFVSTGGKSRKFCTKNFSPAKRGDVLMVMSDLPNGRALARAFYVDDDTRYAVNQRVCILRATAMNPKFLAYSANRNISLLRNDDGANQTHLSNGDFKTMPILCPPRDEQNAIVRMLDQETGKITIASEAAEREISLLMEYRTSLTADVVTGKLDVREAAARLPNDETTGAVETDLVDGIDATEDEAMVA